MKYLKDVLKNKDSILEGYSDQELESHLLNEAEEVEADNVSVALAHLSDIMGMADDLYNTFASLEDLDEGIVKTLEKAYITLDDLYAKVDNEYNIVSYDLDDMEIGDEIKEELASLDEASDDDFSTSSLNTLRMIGFRKVDPSNKAYIELNKKKKGKLLSLYGIPMRAGYYADTFVGIISVGSTKQYFLYYEDEGQIFDTFSNETTLIKDLKTLIGSNDIAETFSKTGDLDEAVGYMFIFQNKMSGKSRKIKAKDEADAIKRMEKIHPPEEGTKNSAEWYKKYYEIFKESLREDLRFIVKYAASRTSKIYQQEFDNMKDAKEFLDSIKKKGMNGIISNNRSVVKAKDEAAASPLKWKVRFTYDDPSGKGIASASITVNAKDAATAKSYAKRDLDKIKIKGVKVQNPKIDKIQAIEEDTLAEKLKASDDASVWIRDFIDSTNPKFDGKSKKERIQMALGAYYAAQKESVEEL